MPCNIAVYPETFAAIQNVDIDSLSKLPDGALRPVLPCLVRMSLCAPLDTDPRWTLERKKILKCLSGIEVVNSLVGLLSIDFHELEQDARKEQHMRTKLGGNPSESSLISQLEAGIALEFERCDAARKLRLLLSELLFIMYQIKEPRSDFYEKSSELFESEVYLEEVSDVLCIAQAELPGLLPINEVAEALLHVRNGPWLLCRLIANSPDTFHEVCTCLVSNGEKQDEEVVGGRKRADALVMLCEMCPAHVLTIRSLCVEYCKQPGLAVTLTLRHSRQSSSPDVSHLVAFVSGLLLDNDANIRNWFAQFIRGSQKKKDSGAVVLALRAVLLDELTNTIKSSTGELSDDKVVQGCAFIRLYSALKCIAGIKFTDEENQTLLQLVTSRPPTTDAGIRFICLGLCMLLACPQMLSNVNQEHLAIDWIKWLINEDHFESSGKASFGEMLLLIAIHFHSNQNNAIADLVSATLGMKSTMKGNTLGRMKTIFTQDVFTEQVVTSHAVKVPVTKNLNANISGYLPIHCIYQLLRSRAFSKNKVQIKDWIYRQLCNCSKPIHPLIPPLIEVFINSIILPGAKTDRTNDPITEQEILSMFPDDQSSRADGDCNGCGEPMVVQKIDERPKPSQTTQILLLYYVLLYQDTLLNNMKSIVSWNRDIHRYSARMMAQLPTKYLLQQTRKEPSMFAGVYASLLRLLATHYPHHFLVSDWLEEVAMNNTQTSTVMSDIDCTPSNLSQAFRRLDSMPGQCILLLERLLNKSSTDIVDYAETIVSHLPALFEETVPRHCQDLVHKIWTKLNSIMPMSLRVMTVNVLRLPNQQGFKMTDYTEDDITLDPLIVLRCDDRIFRCPPLLEINMNILEAFLVASRSFLSTHVQSNLLMDKSGQVLPTKDRDDLRAALVSSQESAAIQILLECCLPNNEDRKSNNPIMSNLREVQGLVCSRLHQMFIADPALAKLVHFQGYPCALLPLTVAGIPSMHICLDFIAELIAQPQIDKQIFTIELVSYLSLQYPIPKSMSVAKLVMNVMNTLLNVLFHDIRADFFVATLPAVVRICRAFPPLNEDAVVLLLQLGRITRSHLISVTNRTDIDSLFSNAPWTTDHDGDVRSSLHAAHSSYAPQESKHFNLCHLIFKTFSDIVGSTTLLKQHLQSHDNYRTTTQS